MRACVCVSVTVCVCVCKRERGVRERERLAYPFTHPSHKSPIVLGYDYVVTSKGGKRLAKVDLD